MKMMPFSLNGNVLAMDEFGWRTIQGGSGFNPQGISAIEFRCPVAKNGKNNQCQIPVTLGPAENGKWHWDGNMEAPTLSPSIGCDHRCGWHGHIVKGEIVP